MGAAKNTNTPPHEGADCTLFRLDGAGGGAPVHPDAPAAKKQEVTWIHLDVTRPRNVKWLTKGAGLRPLVAEALIQGETRPRHTTYPDGLLVVLRGVNLNPGADPEDMVAIRIWIEPGRVITAYRRHLLSVDDLKESLEQGTGPKTPGGFLITLADRLMERAGTVVAELEDRVAEIEEAPEQEGARAMLADLRRQVVSLRRYLSPQREILARLTQEQVPVLEDRHRLQLREVADMVTRYVEDLDEARERASVTHEELVSKISEQMNRRMYVLSMVAAIFLPLGFVTGLLGINVGGIPGSESPGAFWSVVAMMGLVAALVLALFRWRRWF